MTTEFDRMQASRRRFMTAAGAASLALAVQGKARAQGRQALKVSVGRQPWAAGNSPVTQSMIANKSFEKYAADAGYDITVDWRDYPSALPMVEAFVSGNLDFGMWGNTPIVRLIAQNQPLQIVSVGEGHFRFVLATRKDSPIRNVADLKGKTVGALLGGDPYNVLVQWLRYELGNPDPKAHGITVVNTPTQAQAATIPTGMDAAVLIHPAFLKAQAEIGTVGIVNSFGYTESHYKGPAGEGAGILLESVKKSPFYPDGYYLHRSFWIGHATLIRNHPAVVTAFVQAQQEAVARLSGMDPGQVSELARKYWELDPKLGSAVVKDEVLFERGWVWPTEGDALALLETSKYMVEGKMIPKPLEWAQVKGAFAQTAAPLRTAYEKSGRKPDAAAFSAKDAKDVRGAPAWDIASWRERT
ncbi:MAG TPA: ABC transporter substrate-binding protein [Casimicrobiaceae bacterium]|jgi:ABC-type nitrate/sulfonate/bicarbonate transport system substrate-binding protein|nr:ABC transporter substrate-binding protein [Casimicrobiaceae bacterium]